MSISQLPLWSTGGLYKDLEDPRLLSDLGNLEILAQSQIALLKVLPSQGNELPWLQQLFSLLNQGSDLAEHLSSFAYMMFSIDTANPQATKLLGRVEELSQGLKSAEVWFRQGVKTLSQGDPQWLLQFPGFEAYALEWSEAAILAGKQMSLAEEELYNDLSRSGGEAWSRLQGSVSSQLSVVWDAKTGEEKTLVELRALAYDKDRGVRKKAYDLELQAWKTVEIPLAAALNGVKGFADTGLRRRGWDSALEKAAFQARLSPGALDSLILSIEKKLPLFHSYLKDKARLLGIPACGFYDLFAPVGEEKTSWTWETTQSFILKQFEAFSPRMGAFGEKNFKENWIHAPSMKGKVGGAYCTSLPLAGETRILLNFDGSFGEVRTLAHELGHGYHFEVMKDLPALQRMYPMTLAETASIFSETLIFEKAMEQAQGEEELFLLEQRLSDVTQVLVDILSRFYFEKAVMEKRREGELSSGEFSQLMISAQKAAYGEGLDPDQLHPYMWAVKGHYYSPEMGFYNFPYAFGQLFSLGLYGVYREMGPAFASHYDSILMKTGTLTCNSLALELGYNLENEDFWNRGLEEIASQIQKFHQLIEERTR